jgi:hypothetical protein
MWTGRRISVVAIASLAVIAGGGYYVLVPGAPVSPREAIQEAVAASAAAKSASATFTTQVSGMTVLFGTVTQQGWQSSKATLAMTTVDGAERFSVTEIVLGPNVYISTPGLVEATGKHWLDIPVPALTADPAMAQLYQTNAIPAAGAGLLAMASTVRLAGTATIGGVPTSRYVGTIDPSAARAALAPRLSQLLAPELAATTGPIRFTAWIDRQHNFREIETTSTVGGRVSVTTLLFTTRSLPGHIEAPAESQVESLR